MKKLSWYNALGLDASDMPLFGAGAGAVGVGAIAALLSKRKNRIKNAILGAVAGAGAGALAGHFEHEAGRLNYRSGEHDNSIYRLEEAIREIQRNNHENSPLHV